MVFATFMLQNQMTMKTKLQFPKIGLLFSLIAIMSSTIVFAQVPSNDDISGAIAVTTDQTFTGVNIQNATASGVVSTDCSLDVLSGRLLKND